MENSVVVSTMLINEAIEAGATRSTIEPHTLHSAWTEKGRQNQGRRWWEHAQELHELAAQQQETRGGGKVQEW